MGSAGDNEPLGLRVVMLGAGNMGGAMLRGWIASGLLPREDAMVSVRSQSAEATWQAEGVATFGDVERSSEAAAAVCSSADVIFLGVKPRLLGPVLEALRPHLRPRHTVVSIAAGWTLAQLQAALGLRSELQSDSVGQQQVLLARVMPNTPALVGEGACGYCFLYAGSSGAAAEGDERAVAVRALLRASGVALEVAEGLMDAVVGVAGSAPAYMFLVLDAMADGGVRAGLRRAEALRLAAQTMKGAAEMVLRGGGGGGDSREAGLGPLGHPGELKDRVTSPGGPTICAVGVLEDAAVRAAFSRAVVASAARSAEMTGDAER